MHEFWTLGRSEGNTDMRGAGRARREKHQIARADLVARDLVAGAVLFDDRSGHFDGVPRKHISNKAAAIETGCGILSAEAVRDAALRQRRLQKRCDPHCAG